MNTSNPDDIQSKPSERPAAEIQVPAPQQNEHPVLPKNDFNKRSFFGRGIDLLLRRLRLSLTLAFLLFIGVAYLQLPSSVRWQIWGTNRNEPFFHGMPASYWAQRIRDYCAGNQYSTEPGAPRFRPIERPWFWRLPDDDVREEVHLPRCVTQGDPLAIPILAWMLDHSDADVRYLALLELERQGRKKRSQYIRKLVARAVNDAGRASVMWL